MNETELDQLLNRWRTPVPSTELRERVLLNFPQRERRRFGRPLRWALAITVASGVLAIGMEQTGHSALSSLANGVQTVCDGAAAWVDQLWIDHIMSHFLASHPNVYVDGVLQTDAAYGGGGATVWLRTTGEGKYYLALTPRVFEGFVPPVAGRFDGRVLEFQAGGRSVRIESMHSYGPGGGRPVYAMGPVAGR